MQPEEPGTDDTMKKAMPYTYWNITWIFCYFSNGFWWVSNTAKYETSQDHAIECGDEEGQNLPVELNSESSQDRSNENDTEGDQKLPVELNHETSEDNTKEDDNEGGQKLPVELNQEVQFKIGSYIEVEYELNRGRKKERKKYVGEIIDAVNDEPYVSFLDN